MVKRLGSKNANKSRFMMITFRDKDVPRILRNAKKLAEANNEEIRKIIIKPDQTQFQRDEEKKLVKEKNGRNEESKSKKRGSRLNYSEGSSREEESNISTDNHKHQHNKHQ